MKLGIMQPYFFPYIGYWQLMNAVDKYVILDDVNFIKGGWINRNRILMDGKPKMVTLKKKFADHDKHINEIELVADKKYIKSILKTIGIFYKRAPYFSEVFLLLENVITQEEKNMAKFLEYSIRKVCKYLSINTELCVSSSIDKNNDLKCQDKVIEICNILGADEYFNAIGGQELYSYEDFVSQGIKLKFLKTGKVEYQQFNNEFVPNLSIIDVMMFNSPEDIKKMLGQYELL